MTGNSAETYFQASSCNGDARVEIAIVVADPPMG